MGLGLLFLFIAAPFLLMLAGIIQLFRSDAKNRKQGKYLLLIGIAALGLDILIGYSICSNMHFGGLH